MLLNLHVKNLALIDESEIEFGKGFNVLTGETGAGKSLVIGSVNLALGERAPKGLVREGADSALIELVFSADSEEARDMIASLGIDNNGSEILITRKISAAGRSICRINGETVSLSALKKVSPCLIDIHGQHSHEELRVMQNHLRYLDNYLSAELGDLLPQMRDLYRVCRDRKQELDSQSMDHEEQLREISFLQFEIDEINQAGLRLGEDEELEKDYRKLQHGVKLVEAMSEAQQQCSSGADSASERIARSVRSLRDTAGYDEKVDELAGQLAEIESLLDDFSVDLAETLETADFSEERFSEVEGRLNEINRLKEKYGRTIPEILQTKREKETRLEQLNHYETYLQDLKKQYQEAEQKMHEMADHISEIRQKRAPEFAAAIRENMLDLNFDYAEFEIRFEENEKIQETGKDKVRFLISVNPGESLMPLDQAASGGELSRIMLAVKTVLAENDSIDTLIFDEIDTGISGRTAQKTAEKMKKISAHRQLICITHLPQIAAMADSHFLIEKSSANGRTVSAVRRLSRDDSTEELARMLGGVEITDAVRQNAKEMKEMAEKFS